MVRLIVSTTSLSGFGPAFRTIYRDIGEDRLMLVRRCFHSLSKPFGPVGVAQLHNERRYLERLSLSPIFVNNHASPTAIYERDLRYEELLTKAVTIPPN